MQSHLRQGDPDAIAYIGYTTFMQSLYVRPDQGDERAVLLQQGDLTNIGVSAIHALQIFRHNLSSAGQHEQFLQAPRDKKEAIAVDVAQIACAEPPVRRKCRAVGLGTVR